MEAGAQLAFFLPSSGPSAQGLVPPSSAKPVWRHSQICLEVIRNPVKLTRKISHPQAGSDPPLARPFRTLLGGCCLQVSWLVSFSEEVLKLPVFTFLPEAVTATFRQTSHRRGDTQSLLSDITGFTFSSDRQLGSLLGFLGARMLRAIPMATSASCYHWMSRSVRIQWTSPVPAFNSSFSSILCSFLFSYIFYFYLY